GTQRERKHRHTHTKHSFFLSLSLSSSLSLSRSFSLSSSLSLSLSLFLSLSLLLNLAPWAISGEVLRAACVADDRQRHKKCELLYTHCVCMCVHDTSSAKHILPAMAL